MPKLYGCCDNPDCQLCYGSGIVEVPTNEELAESILRAVDVADLNQDEYRRKIRSLCNRVINPEWGDIL